MIQSQTIRFKAKVIHCSYRSQTLSLSLLWDTEEPDEHLGGDSVIITPKTVPHEPGLCRRELQDFLNSWHASHAAKETSDRNRDVVVYRVCFPCAPPLKTLFGYKAEMVMSPCIEHSF